MGKGLEQPDAEEPCGPRDENPPTTELLPKGMRVREHMLEIFRGERRVRFVHRDETGREATVA